MRGFTTSAQDKKNLIFFSNQENTTMAKQAKKEETVELSKKDLKKVSKLEPKIAFFIGRGEKEEAQKIKDQIAAVWDKAKVEQGF
ncbi:hypothetical protein ScalyP_jg4606 [Parmales sp. scaly parma]|nr:hypothetical protein ScalyP_jg4606 [Parmales sp. scaly parma]